MQQHLNNSAFQNMVHMEYICQGPYSCGKIWYDHVQVPRTSRDNHIARGLPYPIPGECPACRALPIEEHWERGL